MSLNPNVQYNREDALHLLKFTYQMPAAEAERALNEAYNYGESRLRGRHLIVRYLHSAGVWTIRFTG